MRLPNADELIPIVQREMLYIGKTKQRLEEKQLNLEKVVEDYEKLKSETKKETQELINRQENILKNECKYDTKLQKLKEIISKYLD